jgi:sialate O-acetylesterase
MVLQREKPVPIWGTGADGSAVTVRIRGIEASAAVKDGKWLVTLPPQGTGDPCSLTVTCGNDRVDYENVLFGDVWLAGGQSNMEWPLIDADGGEDEIKAARNTNIRHYIVPKCPYSDGRLIEMEHGARWTPCVGESAKGVSAVAYWFAKEVNARTGVPIGIIGCNWGGTSAAAWISREALERLVSGRRYVEEFYERVGDKTDGQYEAEIREHDRKWREWKDASDALRAENPGVSWKEVAAKCGEAPWPYPVGRMSPFRPNGLYETMLSRVSPYGLKGFIYYQGEEDWSRHADYFDWMCLLIGQWRYDFKDDALPFFLTQLPMYDTSENIANGASGDQWPRLREAQERVSRFVRQCGMAVTLDCGELDNVHPANKRPVGHRLALQALKKTYGMDVEADGPRYLRCERAGDGLLVMFDKPVTLRGGHLGVFEAAGEDGVFMAAEAAASENTLRVSAAALTEPCSVRYAWRAYCGAPLFGENGLPAAPFWGTI